MYLNMGQSLCKFLSLPYASNLLLADGRLRILSANVGELRNDYHREDRAEPQADALEDASVTADVRPFAESAKTASPCGTHHPGARLGAMECLAVCAYSGSHISPELGALRRCKKYGKCRRCLCLECHTSVHMLFVLHSPSVRESCSSLRVNVTNDIWTDHFPPIVAQHTIT